MALLYTEDQASTQAPDVPPPPDDGDPRREWTLIAIGLVGVVAILAIIVAAFAYAGNSLSDETATVVSKSAAPAKSAADAPAPTLAQSRGVKFEPFEAVDPTLPGVPPGAVKRFTVDVDQHVVQVSPDLAPTEAWTYTVNGTGYKGTAASAPIVVDEGDRVEVTFVNGGTKAMNVDMPHSIDFHSAEVAPNKYYVDVAPGKSKVIKFTADHPGVFMYHCATQPVLMHVGAGMSGMMVVRPRGMAKVDKELWITQGEYYLGKPGATTDMAKLQAGKPDVIAFNGYANQYKDNPITVRKDDRIRMWVLNTGPTKWSAFHVIGTVFDKAVVENRAFPDSQTMNLAPSQGGYAEFTLDQEGTFPFVTHAFGDMVMGAAGVLRTTASPAAAPHGAAKPAAAKPAGAGAGTVDVTLGNMWIKSSASTVKAGEVTFSVKNSGESMHGLAIVEAPAKMAGGMLDESTFLASGKHIAGGETDTVAAELTPGSYELVCHLAGHYAAGQHIPFTVT